MPSPGTLAMTSRSLGIVVLLAVSVTGCSRGRSGSTQSPAPVVRPSDRSAVGAESAFPLGPRPEYRSDRDAAVSDSDLDALWSRQLMVPIEGYSRFVIRDNFTARRGDRSHGALDIMAPRFTAVLAADDGVIERLATTPLGGIIVYATDLSDRFVYYYAHLQRYQPGIALGDTVAKGTVIGYVGTTGNAPPDAPHLHFQVMKRGSGRAWWDGAPINPVQFFVFDGVRR